MKMSSTSIPLEDKAYGYVDDDIYTKAKALVILVSIIAPILQKPRTRVFAVFNVKEKDLEERIGGLFPVYELEIGLR